jgi:hypothetical protein
VRFPGDKVSSNPKKKKKKIGDKVEKNPVKGCKL